METKTNTNVMMLNLGTLAKPELCTGDPIKCKNCAVFKDL